MKRALQISFLYLVFISCSSTKLYYSSEAKKWQELSPGNQNELIYEIYLIGDAGSPSLEIQEPNLKLLEHKLTNSSERSAVDT
ncbi:MAG TPA: hypothetical protein DCL80_13415, partial [Balneola sp.]|nr:hypothetical protein [Balneola sp.]